ncbi:Sulfite exporter TauE/SafE [Pseudooceanicola marinus]|uniref:Probable membrane transporter protein n=1 Tax=Pseudooceanicola marinus TaxID=396013 RepID=A0A1X6ZUB2_9RHOB|nr:sulfite exporter TauE/SafE family protein [Pseudooceanicola marinus]PJE30558.1 sulfite exporter TauE/SafE family protein [Pseudooceanicola marinus]SLN61815.1 Sulfite exporter TauE/SafE [Pseudooceanicola marinus]
MLPDLAVLPDLAAVLVTLAAAGMIAFVKGAFGGGFALIGIPLMSLAMDPLTAGVVLAPLFLTMDLFGLRYWSPSTWSRQDASWLVPGVLAGTLLGTVLLGVLPEPAVAILVGGIALIFTGLWLRGGRRTGHRGFSAPGALLSGLGCGTTSMVAHAGGPPLAMYMLPRDLPTRLYAGTTSIVFTAANLFKLVPWMLVAPPGASELILMAAAVPVIPLALWLGHRLHGRMDARRLYAICYALVALAAVKLLWDGITGLG